MKADATLLLSRSEVAQLLTILESIEAVEKMFRQLGEGNLPAPGTSESNRRAVVSTLKPAS